MNVAVSTPGGAVEHITTATPPGEEPIVAYRDVGSGGLGEQVGAEPASEIDKAPPASVAQDATSRTLYEEQERP